jgi:hypothetical protein
MTNKAAQESSFPLKTLQQWMQTVLISPLGTDGEHPSTLLPQHLQDDIEKIITSSTRLSGRQRLAIYQRGYIARLRDCMAGQFKALQYALTEELFEAFADEYLQQYPSVSYTLTDLGRRFGQFLQETRPDRNLPANQREDWPDFMIELAQLEYALLQIFDATQPENITYATAATADADLKPAPILHIFAFAFPVNHYYQAVHKGENPQLPFQQKSYLAITRKQYQIGMFNLNPLQFAFLYYWQNNIQQTIPQALTQFADDNSINIGEMKSLWQIWKAKWVEVGFFTV